MKYSIRKIVIALFLFASAATCFVRCGSGVEFGAKTFVLTGAGS